MPLKRKSPVGSDRIEPAIFPREIPTGGERGQTLKKRSAHDFDFEWREEHIGDVSGLEAFISEITGIVEGFSNTIDGISNDISNINLALNNKVDKNDPITPSPDSEQPIYQIVQYDSKGLVTAGITPGISHITGLSDALNEKQTIKSALSERYLRERNLRLRGRTHELISEGVILDSKGLFVGGDGSGTWQGISLPNPQLEDLFLTFHIVYSEVVNNTDLLRIQASFMGGFGEIRQDGQATNGDNVFLLYDGMVEQWTVISWWSAYAAFGGFYIV